MSSVHENKEKCVASQTQGSTKKSISFNDSQLDVIEMRETTARTTAASLDTNEFTTKHGGKTDDVHQIKQHECPKCDISVLSSSASSIASKSPPAATRQKEPTELGPGGRASVAFTNMISETFASISDDKKVLAGRLDIAPNEAPLHVASPAATESQPQPPRMLTLPAAINITNEHGQLAGSFNIETDPNNHKQKQSSKPRLGPNRSNRVQNLIRKPAVHLTEEEKDAAVFVKNVSFGYTKRHNILTNISLHVPKGAVYSLLGSSGCGKTTLLKICLGRLRPRKGFVRTFGEEPGSPNCTIPGSGVGFMPQELSLFPNFTIEESLYYYGLLHHMSKEEINRKTNFLVELLNLPPKERQIGMCSGGQQRRASLAVTLFHDPPLLILDEPTVGVDPLLRCKIWQYLEYLCLTQGMTAIITTHYIEESRNSSNLAFMRFGRILVQDTPDRLLAAHNCTILEDVFLRLCQQDCGDIKEKYSIKKKNEAKEATVANDNETSEDIWDQERETAAPTLPTSKRNTSAASLDWVRLKALMFKNMLNLKRNPYVVLFFLVLPVIQITLFCYSVVKAPDHLQIAVYNGESGKSNSHLSKQFINSIDHNLLDIKYYSSQEEAIQMVVDGSAWYAVSLGSNFTRAYQRRAKNPSDLSTSSFEASKIKLYVDHSDAYMLLTIYNSLIHSYQHFVEQLAESFGFNKETVRLPIFLTEVVYGPYDPQKHSGYDFLNNLTPGALVAIIYTAPLIVSAFVVLSERKGGMIERTFVSGATSSEVFLTHLVTLVVGLAIQVTIVLAVAVLIFELQIQGSFYEVLLMLYLCGFCGVLFGLLISSISPNETVALVLALGMVFPFWMMSGVFWPLESIKNPMQRIFWMMPLSYPIRSIDQIVKRGWSYEHASVQLGYFTSLLYNGVLLVANVVAFNLTSK